MTTRISSQQVQVRPAAQRQTPIPAQRRFRQALDEGAQRLVQGAAALSGVAPPGQMVTATRVGASRAGLTQGSGGADLASGLTPGVAGTGASANGVPDDTLELLEMQRRIGAEQVHFSTLSNVLKARHDTAKSVVGNIR